MTFGQSVLAFAALAAVLTVTPGLDTLLVLRTAAVGGRRAAFAASAGIGLGCLCWAMAGAVGVTAVLNTSRVAYDVLRWAGAAYLVWLGVHLLCRRRPRQSTVEQPPLAGLVPGAPTGASASPPAAFRIGLVTNLVNPKVGLFYLSVLPQFVPDGIAPLLASTALAGVHVAEGLLWSTVIIEVVHRAAGWFARSGVRRWLDRLTGAIFVGLAVRLAVDR